MAESAPNTGQPEAPTKAFRRDGLGWLYEPPGTPVRLHVDYLRPHQDELTGEVTIQANLPGVAAHLHQARLNLTSTTARTTLVKHLSGLTDKVSWSKLVEQFCVAVIRQEREGEPFEFAGRRPARLRPPDVVDRLIPSGKPTQLYGPGGVGKGILATAISVSIETGLSFAGLAVAKGRTLYLDWEDDVDEFDSRIKMVSRGLGIDPPEIAYRAMRSTLRSQIHQVASYVQQNGITLLVVDSVELASGSVGERGTYEELAKSFFLALRQVGPVTVLLIDHVSDAARQNKGEVNKAYGSVFKGNWVRNAWEVKKDQEAGARRSMIGLYHYKTNVGGLFQPIGVLLDFSDPGSVVISREDVSQSDTLSKALPKHEQVARALRFGPLSQYDICQQVEGLTEAYLRTDLARRKERFQRLADGRWALIAHEPRSYQEPDDDDFGEDGIERLGF